MELNLEELKDHLDSLTEEEAADHVQELLDSGELTEEQLEELKSKYTEEDEMNESNQFLDEGHGWNDISAEEHEKLMKAHKGADDVKKMNYKNPGGTVWDEVRSSAGPHIRSTGKYIPDDSKGPAGGRVEKNKFQVWRKKTKMNESAIDTLKPGGGSGGGDTKAEQLATFVQLLAQLGKEDLSDIFNQVQAQYGPNQAAGAVDNSQKNAATVAMKPSAAVGTGPWKEDLDDLFAGDELNEELKEKTQVVFEAAVNTRAALVEAELQEEYEAKALALQEEFNEMLQEQASEIFESVTEKLDQYLDYVVEKWMSENEVAIESGIRVQIAEDFMDSLRNVFTEHYITVPESKLDIVADLKEQVDALNEKLNSVLDEKIQLESVNKEYTKAQIIEELSEDLAETQVDKLSTLSEGLEYTDADNFKRKVSILKERYFGTPSKTTGLITEEIDGTIDEETNPGYTTPQMKMYSQAISKSVK